MSADPDIHTLGRLIHQELTESLGLTMGVDVGDAFLNTLFHGTLKTFVERVDSSGFSHTSFGEENGVKCYGHVHYPRDADSVARVLASCGFVDRATRILGFTLRNIPAGQYYIPHVYRPDASIKANTIQVDTPAHTALALARCVELAGPTEPLRELFVTLRTVLDGTWAHHWHEDWRLLDAGNYNEQLDDNETTCDLFTNCAMAAAMNRFARTATTFGEHGIASRCMERASMLESGIEEKLFDREQGIYRMQRNIASGEWGEAFKWINLYCERWYPGRPQAWDNALAKLQRETLMVWDGYEIISGYPSRDQILGKAFGHMLGYLGRTGRFIQLSHYLDFAKATIRRPSHVYPEGWLYDWPDQPSEYLAGFQARFGTTWQPYARNPNGDYTLDSGNAEQCAAFMEHFVQDLLGVKVIDGELHLWPTLPFDYQHIVVTRVPAVRKEGRIAEVGYSLHRSDTRVNMTIERSESLGLRVTVAIPASAINVRCEIAGVDTVCAAVACNDVQWVTLTLSASKQRTEICCVYQLMESASHATA
jgi:hypothetical protein